MSKYKICRLSKKAQVGETLTWVIATIIIIVILLASVFISSELSKIKKIIHLADEKKLSEKDLLMQKTIFAYLLDKNENSHAKIKSLQDEFRGELDSELNRIEGNLGDG